MPIDAVIFDLDGVLIDSETIWSDVRREFAQSHGGKWPPDAQEQMMGMSTPEWAGFMHDALRVALSVDEIVAGVVDEMAQRIGREPPLLPGAADAVRRLASRWPLGLASSSPARVIATVLGVSGLHAVFEVALSTEETGGRGKPAPDVYLEVAARLGVEPRRSAAVEDSTNGLRSARAAGMRVIAVPNLAYPPDPEELARAAVVIHSLDQLTAGVIDPE
jgi:HAD superfamily hydrolase (TIGR01509 family)